MKQIIIRKEVTPALASRVSLLGCKSYTISIPSLETADALLKTAVDETAPIASLLGEYRKFAEGGDSSLFARMYQISETSGLVIDQNIYLYHCDPCPVWVNWEESRWAYMSSRKYVGDPWWFEDAEILRDVQQMNLIDFLEKYKGC
ncbi:hypothetical protein [Candidatus Allofournierella excrementigallinarum]|uniref:hypothetical protein n=1 Tax=Candidatus Allofournierella excrementigallinarum TaxID=2838592 RepID=UPI00374E89B7